MLGCGSNVVDNIYNVRGKSACGRGCVCYLVLYIIIICNLFPYSCT